MLWAWLSQLLVTPGPEILPDVDGGSVVWQQPSGDLALYDIATSQTTVFASATQTTAYQAPAIQGHRIAFQRISSQADIALYDVKLGTLIPVTDDPDFEEAPRVGDDVVVFEDYASGTADVMGYRISTSATLPIATGAAEQLSPDIDGNMVVWAEGAGSASQIFARDLSGGAGVQLTTANSVKVRPRISGNRVVWADGRNGADWDLYVYDLTSGLEQPLVTGPGDQFFADVDGNRLVYIDNATGFDQVHLFTFAPSTYSATVQPPINTNGSSAFNARRGVVPVKFTLTANGVQECQLTQATIVVSRTAGGTLGSINESDFIQPSDAGSSFRIDTLNCQYVYNLSSSSLGPGTYLVQINISGGPVGSAAFSLR